MTKLPKKNTQNVREKKSFDLNGTGVLTKTTGYTLAQDKGGTDFLNTRGNEAQVETLGNWVGFTGGTRGGRELK